MTKSQTLNTVNELRQTKLFVHRHQLCNTRKVVYLRLSKGQMLAIISHCIIRSTSGHFVSTRDGAEAVSSQICYRSSLLHWRLASELFPELNCTGQKLAGRMLLVCLLVIRWHLFFGASTGKTSGQTEWSADGLFQALKVKLGLSWREVSQWPGLVLEYWPLVVLCRPMATGFRGGHGGSSQLSCSWSPLKLFVLMMMKCCLMSSDVSWHIRDKLWPMPKHGSINLYVHGNQKAR